MMKNIVSTNEIAKVRGGGGGGREYILIHFNKT